MKIKDILHKETEIVQTRIQDVLARQQSGKPLRFIHYKGALYYLTGFATDEETLRLNVLYLPMDADPDEIPWSRPAEKFFGRTVSDSGIPVARFSLIGS